VAARHRQPAACAAAFMEDRIGVAHGVGEPPDLFGGNVLVCAVVSWPTMD
jgi:hypothetical protein